MIRSSQHGFTKGKSCLTNFLNKIAGDKGRVVDIVNLDLSKTFEIVSP